MPKKQAHKAPDAKPAAKADEVDIHSMPLEELERRVQRAEALIEELRALFPGLAPKTDEERLHSAGRMRDGEPKALRSVLAGVRLRPELFVSLADQDEGHDPGRFEADLLEDRLTRRELLQRLNAALAPVAALVSDSTLHLGDLTRPALLAAYRIAKTVAQTDTKLRQTVSEALNFFGNIGKTAAATRSKNKG